MNFIGVILVIKIFELISQFNIRIMNNNIHKKLIDNLSFEEQEYLSKINKLSNYTRKNINMEKDFLQQSIYSIIKNWSKNMKNILDDIINIKITNQQSDYWWRDVSEYLNKIIYIFNKEDRKIYIGLTFIVIAFLIFTIEITS